MAAGVLRDVGAYCAEAVLAIVRLPRPPPTPLQQPAPDRQQRRPIAARHHSELGQRHHLVRRGAVSALTHWARHAAVSRFS